MNEQEDKLLYVSNQITPDVLSEPLDPRVVEHITVLEEYFKTQRELFETVQEEPTNEFEKNSHNVKLMELNNEVDKLSRKLSHSIGQLALIRV